MANSPTGRNPVLLWTSARQDVINLMWADYLANPSAPATFGGLLAKRLVNIHANGPYFGTPAGTYGEVGFASAWLYHATGDAQYAEDAYENARTWALDRASFYVGRNDFREYGTELVYIYDWIRHGISTAHQEHYLEKLNDIAEHMTGTGSPGRFDTDELVAYVLCIACLHAATNDHNPVDTATYIAAHGGATPTATDWSSTRNAFKFICNSLFAGGTWGEGTSYNHGTPSLALHGTEAVRTANSNYLDLVAEYEGMARHLICETAPTHRDFPQWGDDQSPRIMMTAFAYASLNIGFALAGVLQGTEVGLYMQQWVIDHIAEHDFLGASKINATGINAINSRNLAMFNPYAPASAMGSGPMTHFASGMGEVIIKNGWDATTDTVFWTQMRPGPVIVHHTAYVHRGLQLWRRGKWALTNPINLGSVTFREKSGPWPDCSNACAVYGAGTSTWPGGTWQTSGANSPINGRTFNKVRGHKFGTGYAYLCGTYGGQLHPTGVWNINPQIPTFNHEVTSSVLYLQGTTKQSDVVILADRMNAVDPESLSAFSKYTTIEQDFFQNSVTAPKLQYFHTRNAPTIGGAAASHNQTFASNMGAIEWLDEGGEPVKIETLRPTVSKLVLDEDVIYAGSTSAVPPASERHWQVRVYPATDTQFTLMLNVVSARNAGTTVSSTLVQDTTNQVYGALITRTDEDNALALFNGVQGADLPDFPTTVQLNAVLEEVRLRRTSYKVNYTQTTNLCVAYLCDLNPDVAWEYEFDSNPAIPLTVDENGIAVITLAGIGAHELDVLGETAPPPVDGPPGPLVNHTPADGAINVALLPTLSWTSLQATEYDVYFGAASGGTPVQTSITRSPTGNGASTILTALTGAATAWEACDDAVGAHDDGTTFAAVSEANGEHLFTFAATSVPASTVHSVTLHARLSGATTVWTRRFVLRIGGTNYFSATGTVQPNTYAAHSVTYTIDPSTGLAWTAAGVNAIQQFGLSITNNTGTGDAARCTQAYAVVSYTPSGGPSLVSAAQAGNTYAPAALTNNTVYEWRIVARNVEGEETGPFNSFTTVADPGPDLQPQRRQGNLKKVFKVRVS